MNVSYKLFNLSNDIRVIYLPKKDNNISAISVFCNVGSINENKEQEGMSHFLEHILFKGTKERPNPKFIANELDSVGAYFNAYTDKNVTSYIVKVSSDNLEKGINIISDMLLNSTLLEKDIMKEINVVIEEVNKGRDNPTDFIFEKIYEIIYKGHPLAHSIGGDEKTIRNYKRDSVKNYLQKNYNANNIVISISSNLSLEEIKKFLNNSYFPKYNSSISNNLSKTKYHICEQNCTRYMILNKPLEQLNLALGFKVCNMYDDERFTLHVLKIILAGNMSSRLFTELREKAGLSYNVAVDLSLYEDQGSFIIYTSFDKDSLFCKNQSEIDFNSIKYKNYLEKGGLPIILDNLKNLKLI